MFVVRKPANKRLVAKGSVGIGGHINDVDYKEPLLAFTKEPLPCFYIQQSRNFKTLLKERFAKNFPFKACLMPNQLA